MNIKKLLLLAILSLGILLIGRKCWAADAGITPADELTAAAFAGNIDLINDLLDRTPILIKKLDSKRHTALMEAALNYF